MKKVIAKTKSLFLLLIFFNVSISCLSQSQKSPDAINWASHLSIKDSLVKGGDTSNAIIHILIADSLLKMKYVKLDSFGYYYDRNLIAHHFMNIGMNEKAIDILKQSINVFELRDSINSKMYTILLTNIAKSYSNTQQCFLSKKYYETAFIFRKKNLGWEEERTIQSALNVTGINDKIGVTSENNEIYRQILDGVSISFGLYSKQHIWVLALYADYLIKMGRYSKSLEIYKSIHSCELFDKFDVESKLNIIYHVGRAYWEMDNLDSALRYWENGLELSIKNNHLDYKDDFLHALAEIFRLKGQHKKALNLLSKLTNNMSDDFGFNVMMGAINFELNKYKKALTYYASAKKIIEKNESYPLEGKHKRIVLFNQISTALLLLNDRASSLSFSNLSIDLIYINLNPNREKLSQSEYYKLLKKYEEKINWFFFVSALQPTSVDNGKSLCDKRIYKYAELFHFPPGSNEQLGQLKKNLNNNDSLNKYIENVSNILDTAVYVRFIKFALADNNEYGYLLTIQNSNHKNNIYREVINASNYLDSMLMLNQSLILRENNGSLYFNDLIWKKLWSHLTDKQVIYFALDGVLNKVNIETFLIKDSVGVERFLGDKFEVRLINSSADLFIKPNTSQSNDFIAFGYPDYTLSEKEQQDIVKNVQRDSTLLATNRGSEPVTGSYKFDILPATKFEVESIAETLKNKGWQTTVYTGADALEENIKKVKSPRILHIATHGFFAEDIKPEVQERFMGMDSRTVIENPLLRSGLALAGAERTRTDTNSIPLKGLEDGILTAEEVQYLHLDSTELVVLSACETGLGEIVNGEGVYGLQRAFRAAGAKSVLMSLWKVDDFATMELMKSFYKHWLEDGMTKHDALWQAKLDLRNNPAHPEWSKPYYWGAFVLIGE